MTVYDDIITNIGRVFGVASGAITGAYTKVQGQVVSFLDPIITAVETIILNIADIPDAIEDFFTDLPTLEDIQDTFQDYVVTPITDTFSDLIVTPVENAISAVVDSIVAEFNEHIVTPVKTAIEDMITDGIDQMRGAWT